MGYGRLKTITNKGLQDNTSWSKKSFVNITELQLGKEVNLRFITKQEVPKRLLDNTSGSLRVWKREEKKEKIQKLRRNNIWIRPNVSVGFSRFV